MIVRDRVGDVLQQHRLAGARRRHDQRALALADRRDDVDDARREVLLGRILVFHLQPLVRIERRQIVEIDLVAGLFGVFEIERIDLEQREVALAFLRAADVAVDGVAGAQAEAADLRGRDVDVVRAGQIIRLRRAQKAEAVRQHLDHAFADDVGFAGGELFEDAEHQLLLAHGRGVLDLKLFGEGDELRRRLGLEFLEFHFPHTECPMEIWPAAGGGRGVAGEEEEEVAGLGLLRGLGAPVPDASAGSNPLEPELNCIRLRSVGCAEDKQRPRFTQVPRRDLCTGNAPASKRFQHHQKHDGDHQHRRYFIDYPIESLRMPVLVGGEILYPAGQQTVQRRQRQNQRDLGLQPARANQP